MFLCSMDELASWFEEAKRDGNPYLSLWFAAMARECDLKETFFRDHDAWRKEFIERAEPNMFAVRNGLCGQYSWAIPCEEALDEIAKHGPIIEVGAGTGYWAWLLRKRGVDVLAFDRFPPGPGRTAEANHWHGENTCWTEIRQGDPSVLAEYGDRTLFLCWPPYDQPMALECLNTYQGRKLIVIGEHGGCTGCEKFWEKLDSEWERIATVDLPQWDGLHDYLMVYERK